MVTSHYLMPCLQVRTNVKLTEEQKQKACLDLSKIVAQLTGKPEAYVMVMVQECAMSFAGSADPCCFMDLRSIGCISKAQNKKHSATLTKYVADNFKVAENRVYISFANVKGEDWGYGGDTFA